ncbi:Mov34/MPN/PAD-1 family protein [Photobacterium nomapromontoriensis]|uniref:Mov34/MPN/PAD-1 family protein n=1 Tax=Photobacterium nomapromontoriensis TaxID=2910237 RepID=UPI003D0CCC70
MLVLPQGLVDAMVKHATNDHPIEACGILIGDLGSDHVETFQPMVNIAKSSTYFQFDSTEQLKVWREMDRKHQEAIVFYHSHTTSRAYPSREDLAFAQAANTHHVIISTAPDTYLELRSYRYVQGRAVEETIKIIQ